MTLKAIQSTERKLCSICGAELQVAHGYMVCSECGTVAERVYISGRYNRENGGGRAVDPMNVDYLADDAGTDIAWGRLPMDGKGKALSPHRRRLVGRLRIWQHRTRSLVNRRVRLWLMLLHRVVSNLDISEGAHSRAAGILKGLKSGWNNRPSTGLIAAALFMACREYSIPLMMSEIAEGFPSPPTTRQIRRALFSLQKTMGRNVKVLHPVAYVSRLVSALKKNEDIKARLYEYGANQEMYWCQLERDVIEALKSMPYTDRRGQVPIFLAASAIYIYDPLKQARKKLGAIRQTDCTDVCGGSEVTIRKQGQYFKNMRWGESHD